MPLDNEDKNDKRVPIAFITLAQSLLPEIQSYFESEEGHLEFDTWKKAREQENTGNCD